MPDDGEISQAANYLVDRRDQRASAYAGGKANELFATGNSQTFEVWQRICRAVNERKGYGTFFGARSNTKCRAAAWILVEAIAKRRGKYPSARYSLTWASDPEYRRAAASPSLKNSPTPRANSGL